MDFHNVVPDGMNLTFFIPLVSNNGNYTCVVAYSENGRLFHLTRTVSVKVVGKHGLSFTSTSHKGYGFV